MFIARVKERLYVCVMMGGHALYQHRRVIKMMLLLLIFVAGFSAQAAGTEDLKKGMANILKVIMIVGFPMCVAIGIYAGVLWSKGQTQEAKNALISTGIIAAAPMIAYVMYEAMGLGDYAVDIEDGDL
jgi:phosphate/sulfate permease